MLGSPAAGLLILLLSIRSSKSEPRVTQVTALYDHVTGAVLYKDPSARACFIEEDPTQANWNGGAPILKILPISNTSSSAGIFSHFQQEFCGEFPIFRILSLDRARHKRLKRVHRARRSAGYAPVTQPAGHGTGPYASESGIWPGAQTQVQGDLRGQGFFSGQAQSVMGGMSQSQIQMGGTGLTGSLSSAAGGAQAQLSLGARTGSGQVSSLGRGPSNSQLQVSLGEENVGSNAHANVVQHQALASSGHAGLAEQYRQYLQGLAVSTSNGANLQNYQQHLNSGNKVTQMQPLQHTNGAYGTHQYGTHGFRAGGGQRPVTNTGMTERSQTTVQNGHGDNGRGTNGHQANGHGDTGRGTNGQQANGHGDTSRGTNGHQANGHGDTSRGTNGQQANGHGDTSPGTNGHQANGHGDTDRGTNGHQANGHGDTVRGTTGHQANGHGDTVHRINGHQANGHGDTVRRTNGHQANGHGDTGRGTNGHQANGQGQGRNGQGQSYQQAGELSPNGQVSENLARQYHQNGNRHYTQSQRIHIGNGQSSGQSGHGSNGHGTTSHGTNGRVTDGHGQRQNGQGQSYQQTDSSGRSVIPSGFRSTGYQAGQQFQYPTTYISAPGGQAQSQSVVVQGRGPWTGGSSSYSRREYSSSRNGHGYYSSSDTAHNQGLQGQIPGIVGQPQQQIQGQSHGVSQSTGQGQSHGVSQSTGEGQSHGSLQGHETNGFPKIPVQGQGDTESPSISVQGHGNAGFRQVPVQGPGNGGFPQQPSPGQTQTKFQGQENTGMSHFPVHAQGHGQDSRIPSPQGQQFTQQGQHLNGVTGHQAFQQTGQSHANGKRVYYYQPQTGHDVQPHNGHGVQPQNGHSLQPQNGHSVLPQNGHSIQSQNGHSVQPQNSLSSVHPQNGHSLQSQNGHSVLPQNGQIIQSQNGHSVQPQNSPSVHPQNGHSLQSQNGHSVQSQNGHIVQPQNGHTLQSQNGHSVQSQNGHNVQPQNGHSVHSQSIPTRSQTYQPQQGSYAAQIERPQLAGMGPTGTQGQTQNNGRCSIITFTCTIVVDQNGRAKVCRPKGQGQTNGNGQGHHMSGPNGQQAQGPSRSGICCC